MDCHTLIGRMLGMRDRTIEASCERLEERCLMDAPTATLVSQELAAGEWDVVVRYASADGIRADSIDGADIGLTGPDGFSQLGTVIGTQEVNAGSAIDVRYRFFAPGGHWSWVNTGTYNIGLAPGQVRSTGGDLNAEAGIGSYWRIWSTPLYRLVTPNVNSGNEMFRTSMRVDVDVTPAPWDRGNAGPAVVNVAGPNGFSTRIVASAAISSTLINTRHGPTTRIQYRGLGTPPGGVMDPADNGRYDYRVAVMNRGVEQGTFFGASFFLWWGDPAAGNPNPGTYGSDAVRILSSTATGTEYRVVVRYSAAAGVDVGTIGDDDLSLTITKHGSFFTQGVGFYRTARLAFRLAEPVQVVDGGVTATYVATGISPGGFSRHEHGNAQVQLKAGAVLGTSGALPPVLLEERTISSVAPTAIGLRLYGRSANTAEFAFRVLDIDDERWNIEQAPAGLPPQQFPQWNLEAWGRQIEIVTPSGQVRTPVATYYGLTPQVEQNAWRGWNVRVQIVSGIESGLHQVYMKAGAMTIGGLSTARWYVGSVMV